MTSQTPDGVKLNRLSAISQYRPPQFSIASAKAGAIFDIKESPFRYQAAIHRLLDSPNNEAESLKAVAL